MNETRHGGCADCGSTEEKVLTSVMQPYPALSLAVCSKCLPKYSDQVKK